MPNMSNESVEFLYNCAKEEYNYQRERIQKLEAKVEMIIGFISTVFTFEIANAFHVLKIDYIIDSFEKLKSFLSVMIRNIPYVISLILLIISIVLLLTVIFSIKLKVVSVLAFYNKEKYNENKIDILTYTSSLYVACTEANFNKLNKLYKMIYAVIIMSIVSMISYGISYLV